MSWFTICAGVEHRKIKCEMIQRKVWSWSWVLYREESIMEEIRRQLALSFMGNWKMRKPPYPPCHCLSSAFGPFVPWTMVSTTTSSPLPSTVHNFCKLGRAESKHGQVNYWHFHKSPSKLSWWYFWAVVGVMMVRERGKKRRILWGIQPYHLDLISLSINAWKLKTAIFWIPIIEVQFKKYSPACILHIQEER